ncbi:MAG: four helix bundle protein [Dissulfuribacterales bacterium]
MIEEKSFEFAVRIVKLYKWLCKGHNEYVLSKQLLRSGTSIGANITEAQAAQSKKDFIAKMAIASKEARESKYWLRLLIRSDYLNKNDVSVKSFMKEINDIINIVTKIVKTSQGK